MRIELCVRRSRNDLIDGLGGCVQVAGSKARMIVLCLSGDVTEIKKKHKRIPIMKAIINPQYSLNVINPILRRFDALPSDRQSFTLQWM